MKSAASVVIGFAAFLIACGAGAQSGYPEKSVRMLVGFSAGGPADLTARLVAQKLSEAWGKPVVVENVTGAGGNLSTERVVRALPDGYTLAMATGAQVVINQNLYGKLPFDPVRELVPIMQVSAAPNILAVSTEVPVRSVKELVALAAAQPGKLSFASSGAGTTQHLSGELFKSITKIDLVHIPYKGATAAVPDLLAGRVTMFFGTVATLMPLVREGKLRGLAVTSAKRSPAAPEVPTMMELGYEGFEVTAWYGLLAPAGTPEPVIRKIHADTARALAQPDVRARFADLYLDVIGNSPEEMAQVIKAEIPKWAKIIRDSGAKAD